MRLIGAAFAALMAWQGQWSPVAVIDGDAVMRGLAPDAIPSIDAPVFVEGATTRELRDDELVIGVTNGRTTKAYSAWHLNSHEIVNDLLDGQPIAVTWCPLCFTGIVYSRMIEGRPLQFGVSGLLWRENLVMYDRDTGSWWSQATGRSIRGPLEGRALTMIPAAMMSWGEWRRLHPDTLVLSKSDSRSPVDRRDVYAPYHDSAQLGVTGRMRSLKGPDPKLRVAGFRHNGDAFAIDLSKLRTGTVALAFATTTAIVIAGQARDSARVFLAGNHAFSVRRRGEQTEVLDQATGSHWSAEGLAVDGVLQGQRLAEVPVTTAYWFAWRAFFPATTWVEFKE